MFAFTFKQVAFTGLVAVSSLASAWYYETPAALDTAPAAYQIAQQDNGNNNFGPGNGFGQQGQNRPGGLSNPLSEEARTFLHTNMQNHWANTLTQAADQELITQEQADELTQRGWRGGPGGQNRPGNGNGPMGQARQADMAAALGITAEQLATYQAEGLTPPQIAAELGLDWDVVQAQLHAQHLASIQEAVANGQMTQEQADQMVANMNARWVLKDAFQAAMAEVLGITPEQLDAYQAEGKRLPEIATELGLDLATLQTQMQTARQAVLDAAVADGTITQEQADNFQMGGPGQGGHGGQGQHNGQGGGFGGPRP